MKGKKKFILTKIFTFDSAHRLVDYDGKCSNLHGHTYKLEVSIAGDKDDKGMVIDFGIFKKLVEERVIDLFDHKYLNELMEFNPTAENICEWIWDELEPLIETKGYNLDKIVLWETPTSCCTLQRERE